MGFFDKINYSMIVNTLKKILHRGDSRIFFTLYPTNLHIPVKLCFTVSGRAQKVHAGWPSAESKV